MCEFCNFGPSSQQQQHGNDQTDLRFAGFFSEAAIEAALRQSAANVESHNNSNNGGNDEEATGEEDDDGT